MRRSRGRSKFRRLVEGLLLLAGVIGIGAWAWWNIRGSVMQDWQSWVFDRRVHGQSAPITEYLSERSAKVMGDVRAWLKMPPAAKPTPALPTPPPSSAGPVAPPERPPAAPSVPPNGLLGRLDIPRLHLKAMVREGVDEDTLGVALGHIPSTAFPGQSGNVGVAGHRDKLFRGLRKIHKDDLIQFETLGASYEYKVESTEIVKPADVGVLKAGQYPELTLVTCYPFYYVGSAPDRFIVKARQISASKPSATPPEPQVAGSGSVPAGDAPPEQKAAETQPAGNAPPEQKTAETQPAGDPPAAQKAAETGPAGDPPAVTHSAEAASIAPATPTATRPTRIPHSVDRSADRSPGLRKVRFQVAKGHSRSVAPGISLGLTGTDAARRSVDGWLWVVSDRRTIWLRGRMGHDPVVFYSNGSRRELVITSVTKNAISGYLAMPADRASGRITDRTPIRKVVKAGAHRARESAVAYRLRRTQ